MTPAGLFYRVAQDRFDEGAFADARDTSAAGLVLSPDHPGLNELHGLALYELEDLSGALHVLETASVLAPLSPLAQLSLADLYARFGQAMASRAIYEFLAESARCPVPLLSAVVRGLARHGLYETALDVCRRLIDLRPGYHPAYFGAAFYIGKLGGSPVVALSYLQTAFDLAPECLSYRVSLASVLVQLGRFLEAYRLIRTLPVDAVGCRCCLVRMLAAAEQAGDKPLAAAYRDRIDRTVGVVEDDTEGDGFEY